MPRPQPPLPLAAGDAPLTGRARAAVVLAGLLLAVVIYLPEPDIFGTIDWVRIHGFYEPYLAAALRAGRLPLWNPHVALGRPFLADVDAALFSPPNLLFVIADAHVACVLVIALHLALLLYGVSRVVRALGGTPAAGWAAGVVFAGSAPIVGSFHSGLVHYGAALCYLPLVVYLGLRLQAARSLGAVAMLAVALGLQLLAGHPQAAWLTVLGTGVFMVGRRLEHPLRPALAAAALDAGGLVLAAAWALAIAGVTVLPVAELMGQSNRHGPTLAFATSFALQGADWATLVVPSAPLFSRMPNAQLYLGAAPLILGACGLAALRDRNARALLLVAVVAALLAVGTSTPAFALFYRVLPGLATMRLPSRASVLVVFALVLAGALLLSRSRADRATTLRIAIAGALAAAAAFAFVRSWPGFAVDGPARGVARAGLIAAAALLSVLWTRRTAGRARNVLGVLLAAITAGDLAVAIADLKPQNRDEPERPMETAVHDALVRGGLLGPGLPPPRVSLPKPWVREDAGMTEGWSTFTGYAALQLARVWDYEHAVLGLPVPVEQNTYPSGEIFRRGPFSFDSMALVLGFDPVRRVLVLNPRPDPRAYLAPAAVRVADHREAIARMRAGHDFHRVALTEDDTPLPAVAGDISGSARITRFEPEAVTVETDSPRPALLVLAEAYYPGWEATVNGAPAPCRPVNAWMRGVAVSPGRSRVELRFRSRFLLAGAALSLLSAGAALAVLLRKASSHGPRLGKGLRMALDRE